MFLSFSFRQGNEEVYRTAIVTGEGTRIVPGYAAVWYDDLENPVIRLEGGREWYDDQGRRFPQFEDANYIFRNGSAIPRRSISNLGRVLGGDYVILKFKEKPAWIVSKPESPRQALFELPEDLDDPEGAFATAGELIIFGTWKLPHGDFIVKCLKYQESPTGYQLSEEIPIPWAGTVYDMDVKTGDALITGRAQKFAGYYRFTIRIKHRAWLGFAPSDNVLFLKDDVIRTIDAALQKTP